MVIKYKSSGNDTSQRGDDVHFSKFQSCCCNSATQTSQIVLVCIGDFLDKAMLSQSFQQSGHLMPLFVFDDFAQALITESADVKFSANNDTEQLKVIAVKEVESSITSLPLFDGVGYLVEIFDAAGRVINSRDKLKISAIGCFHQLDKQRHTVNGFFQRRISHFPCAVPVFHPSVVLKKRNIIGHSLNSKNQTELIIHFYGYFAHPMFNTSSFNPRVKVIAHFILIAAVEFTAEERGDILGFDRVNGGTDNFVIDQFKVAFLLEDYIGGIFDLHKTPMIVICEIANYRTVLPDEFIQPSMNTLGTDIIGKLLSLIKIVNLHKDIVEHLKIDILLIERRCQQIMSVTVELQPERRPCWNSQITQPQFGGDKVEVIVQAFAGHCLERCCVSLFVVPGFIGGAQFHCRKYMHKPRMRTSLFYDAVDLVFFTEILFANKIDFQVVVAGDFFGICTDIFPQRICPFCEVKYTNVFCSEKGTHPLGIADTGYGSGKYDSVKAGDDSFDFSIVPLDKVLHRSNSPYRSFQIWRFSEKYLAA